MNKKRKDIERTIALMKKIKRPLTGYTAESDATKVNIPQAHQATQDQVNVPSDWELEEKYDITPDPRGESGRVRRKELAAQRKYELYNARMAETRSNKPIPTQPKGLGTFCPACEIFHKD
jgi:hypothetical protein